MLQKIKDILVVIRGGLLYVLTPLGLLLGYIWYLTSKITTLTDKLNESKAVVELAKTIEKKVDAENEANKDESDYIAMRDALIKQSGPSDVPLSRKLLSSISTKSITDFITRKD